MLQFLTYLFIAIYTATVIGIILVVILGNRNPLKTIPWVVVLIFAPVVGLVFYFFFGQDLRRKRIISRRTYKRLMVYALPAHVRRSDAPVPAACQSLSTLLTNTSQAVSFYGSRLTHYGDGASKMTALLEEIEKARDHIHILYYIFCDDETGARLQQALIRKAKEGVKVRVLYDDVGCNGVKKEFFQQMRDAGAEVHALLHVRFPMLTDRVNYRNHRKIVVIDGTTGFVGGFNIGREYISKDPQFGYWRDTHLKIKGEAAISLQIRFALDWNYATGENLFKDLSYFGDEAEAARKRLMGEGNGHIWPKDQADAEQVYMQIITSGPDTREPHIRNNYLELFHKAKRHIYIQTPYFIPDDAILSALKIAASSGVDVRLMIPCKPDHPFVYWATCSYAGELLDYGARCYVYENGFLHSKGVMVDGQVSCYGTANMDIRSFELNFEVNATIYDQKTTERLEKAFMDDLPHCREITREDYHSRRLWMRLKEQMCRLLSPLL